MASHSIHISIARSPPQPTRSLAPHSFYFPLRSQTRVCAGLFHRVARIVGTQTDTTRPITECERTFTRPIVMQASPGVHSFCNCWKTALRENLSRERAVQFGLDCTDFVGNGVFSLFYN